MSTIETEFQTERLALVEKEKELNALLERFQEHERAIADMQKRIAVLKTEEENASQHAVRTKEEIAEHEQKIVQLTSRRASLAEEQGQYSSRVEEFGESVTEKKNIIAGIDTEKKNIIAGIEQEISEIESAIEDKRRDIFELTDTLSTLNNDLTRFQSAIESMVKKEEEHLREIEEMTSSMEQLEHEIASADSRIVEKNNDLAGLRARKEALESSLSGTKELIQRLRGEISALKEEVASDNSRLSSLREITSEALTTELLTEAEKFHVRGTLSDIVSVDTRYEKAVEAVLNERVNGFVLSSSEDISAAASFIREKGLSRTALMIDSGAAPGRPDIPGNESLIGAALDFVEIRDGFEGIVKTLLTDVLIVKDIGNAFELKSQNPGFTFVTPGGDVLDSTYTVFSGEGKGILTRKREIRELGEAVENKQKALADKERRLQEAQAERERTEAEITSSNERAIAVERELSVHRIELQNMHQENERIQKKKAFIKLEVDQARQEKESIQAKVRDSETSIASASQKRKEFEATLASHQEVRAEKRAVHESHRSALTDLQMQIAGLREKIDGLNREMESTSQAIAESERKIISLNEELVRTEETITSRQELAEQIDGEQKERVVQIDALRSQISERKEHLGAMSSILDEKEKTVRSLREVSARVSSREVSMTEYRLKMENIFNNMIHQYGVNIDQLETEEPTEEDLEKLGPLREKIQSIGPVNLGTIEEYEELKERHQFLSTQQEDLTKSIEELEEAIKKINHTTRKRLREAYDALNAKFGEVFTHLFNGGKAELVLTDDQNILEAGIDIIAQPPGKRLRNIMQLSGGEKALTAIAIVFAGFLIKPSPICILDEADAPLDDSNTDRYANLVKELSSNTQFIVITHNRTTMESAEHIYGITMEEPGTSKVISMQLTEA